MRVLTACAIDYVILYAATIFSRPSEVVQYRAGSRQAKLARLVAWGATAAQTRAAGRGQLTKVSGKLLKDRSVKQISSDETQDNRVS